MTGTPLLRLVLSKLLRQTTSHELPMLDEALARKRPTQAEQVMASIQAGWLPVLRIGLVFRNGQVVGRLGTTTRTFVFSKATHSAHIENVSGLGHYDKSGLLDLEGLRRSNPGGDGTRPGLLGGFSYPLLGAGPGRSRAGRILSIRSRQAGAEHLILPCPEVLRTMYAPHSSLALALLAGPWGMNVGTVLDTTETRSVPGGAGEDPVWEVHPKHAFGRQQLVTAANLWLNDFGRRAAENIWAALQAAAKGAAVIEARIPFEWSTLELGVSCVDVTSAAAAAEPVQLGYVLEWLRWPDPPSGPPAVVRHLKDVSVDGGGAPPPPPGRPRPRVGILPQGETSLPTDTNTDPQSSSVSVRIIVDGARWTNLPDIEVVERESTRTRNRHGPPGVDLLGQVSTGKPRRGGTGAARGRAEAVDPFGGGDLRPDRFSSVLELLAGMFPNDPVLPPRSAAASRRLPQGLDLPVWAFPDEESSARPRWQVLVWNNGEPVRRTAMVRSIVVGGTTVYWMETEIRPANEYAPALVFVQPPEVRLERLILSLLGLGATVRGSWPGPDAVAVHVLGPRDAGDPPPVPFSEAWRHRPGGDGGGYSAVSAHAVLTAVSALARPPDF